MAICWIFIHDIVGVRRMNKSTQSKRPKKKSNILNDGLAGWFRFVWKAHIANPLWRSNEERRLVRERIYSEAKTEYLKKYIPFIKNLKVSLIESKEEKDLSSEKVFSLWLQGEENAPEIVKSCFGSMRATFGDKFLLLDENKLKDFIELPDFIMKKWKNKEMGGAHYSDIIRVELLYKYGGYWFDATDFVTGPVDKRIEEAPFFMYMASDTLSPDMFVQNCFIRAKKGDPLLSMWRALIHEYWKNEDGADYYFLVQNLFKLLVTYNEEAKRLFEKMPKIKMDPTHLLWHKIGDKPYDAALLRKMKEEAFFQKTSYKKMKRSINGIKPWTMADYTINGPFQVDMVYLWVNGNDPEWQKKFSRYDNRVSGDAGINCEGRFSENDELRHSLRSVEKYAPWIRKIFIVTDSQVPEWLDATNPKVEIVDHTQILDPEALPTFNSCVIEHALFRIPALSEHFLYANDDMFLNQPVDVTDFFLEDGRPIVRFNYKPFRKLWLWYWTKVLKKPLNNYKGTVHRTACLVEKRYGKYIGHKTHHNIDAYRKSDYRHTYEVFRKEIEDTMENHLRNDNDIQRNIYSYVPVIEKKAKVKFVGVKTSFHCHIDLERHFEKLKKVNPVFFCLNDSQYSDETARRRVKDFLEKRYPEKSQFEKK